MKKISIIIGFVFALVVASVLLRQHYKHPSDAKLSGQIIGTWIHPVFSLTVSPDGGFSMSIGPRNDRATNQGTWRVKDEELVMAVTNTLSTKSHETASVGSVARLKIIHLDDHKLIYEREGETTALSR